MERCDQRIIRTKKALSQTLVSLLREKSIDRITVSEICRLAGINRNTFYAYYEVPSDILNEIILDHLQFVENGILIMLQDMDAEQVLYWFCEAMYTTREDVNLIIGEGISGSYRDTIVRLAVEKIAPELADRLHVPLEQMQELIEFAACGALGMLRRWHLSGYEETPQTVARRINRLSLNLIYGSQN